MLPDPLLFLMLTILPNLPLLLVFVLFQRLQVYRELFICFKWSPLDQFHKHPALEWRDYFPSPKVAADRIYKRMSVSTKASSPRRSLSWETRVAQDDANVRSASCATRRPSTASCSWWPPFAGCCREHDGVLRFIGLVDELLDDRSKLTGS